MSSIISSTSEIGGDVSGIKLTNFPTFTRNDDDKEKANLNVEERQKIEDDIHGANAVPPRLLTHDTVEQISNKQLDEFIEAMDDIPLNDRSTYEEALIISPYLIPLESNPLWFIVCENNNMKRAAKRMARYWEMRKLIFGPVDCFQPMSLLDGGSMANDLDTMMNAPNYIRCVGLDVYGRPVLIANSENIDIKEFSRKQTLRILWYVVHVMLKDHVTVQNGIVVINFCRNCGLAQYDRKRNMMIMESFKSCLPVKVQAIHCVTSMYVMNHILPAVKWYMGKRMRLRIKLHSGDDSEVYHSLCDYGIQTNEHFFRQLLDAHDPNSIEWILREQTLEQEEQEAIPNQN